MFVGEYCVGAVGVVRRRVSRVVTRGGCTVRLHTGSGRGYAGWVRLPGSYGCGYAENWVWLRGDVDADTRSDRYLKCLIYRLI